MVTVIAVFKNPNKFYFEGEELSVKIVMSVEYPINVFSIVANFLGECTCGSDTDTDTKQRPKSRNENEIYFDDVLTVFLADRTPKLFPEGVHQYSVQYQLPISLPSSLETPRGHVRYSLNVIADVGGSLVRSHHYFTVVAKVCFSNDACSNVPVILWKYENGSIFSCLCSRAGPLRAFVNIPKKSFLPGEILSVNAEVWNFSSMPVNWVKAGIVQVVRYYCAEASKVKRIVAEVTRGCILPHDNQVWRSENLGVPAVPPSSRVSKRMIGIQYKFYFAIKTSWQEKTITLKQNITIGAVPVAEFDPSAGKGQAGGRLVAPAGHSHHYSSLEPCIFGPHFLIREGATFSFSPLYPVYTQLCC